MIREQLGPDQQFNLPPESSILTKHEQDTVLIVSFAEMREKLGSGINDNFLIKHKRYKSNLSELVRDGATKIKHKGTVLKIRRKVNSNYQSVTEDDDTGFNL